MLRTRSVRDSAASDFARTALIEIKSIFQGVLFMYARNRSIDFSRFVRSSRTVATALVSLTLLTAACSDTMAPRNSSALRSTAADLSAAAASNFGLLANAGVTCTDGRITGNVGTLQSAPTGALTLTTCPMSGAVNLGDDAARQAFSNFVTAYAASAPQPGDVCTTLTGTLAGVSLAPGNYCFDVAATVTGLLTLDGPADGVWNFKIGSSGTGALTGTGFNVAMAGGGQACNVTWRVADAATMTTSNLKGNLMTGAAITLTGGTYTGNAWSKADVTITGTATTSCNS